MKVDVAKRQKALRKAKSLWRSLCRTHDEKGWAPPPEHIKDWIVVKVVTMVEDVKVVCPYCGQRCPPKEISLDHILPISRGGTTVLGNLALCHKRCNRRKHNVLIHEFEALRKVVDLMTAESQISIWTRLAAGGTKFR